MKNKGKYFLLALLGSILLLNACDNAESKTGEDDLRSKIPVLAMVDSTTYQFGNIKEGDIVEHEFRFTNGGQFPLIINNVTASCGCTIPEWPREPIPPAGESSIKVRFNSKGKPGMQFKTITVYANTEPATSELRIQGQVEESTEATVEN